MGAFTAIWSTLFGSGGVTGAVSAIAPYVTKNKDTAEKDTHDEQDAAATEQTAEFTSGGTGILHDIVDFINRLPRPLMAFGVMWLIWEAGRDPIYFAQIMTGLALVPPWLAIVMGQVILLFFGGRMMENWPSSFDGPSKALVTQTLDTLTRLRAMKDPPAPAALSAPAEAISLSRIQASAPIIDEGRLKREMADTGTPLSDDAIAEWNRKRQAGAAK